MKKFLNGWALSVSSGQHVKRIQSTSAILALLLMVCCVPPAIGQLVVSNVSKAVDDKAYEALLEARKLRVDGQPELAMQLLAVALDVVQSDAPGANPASATICDEAANVLQQLGKLREAATMAETSLQMRLALYPVSKFPAGHPDLVLGFANTGELLRRLGRLDDAEKLTRTARAIAERLYSSPERFPRGHKNLQGTTNSLGVVLTDLGRYTEAAEVLDEALEMGEKLYLTDQYPDGSEPLLQTLNNRADAATRLFDCRLAENLFQRALAMADRLYPESKFPNGQASLVLINNNHGFLASTRGDFVSAEKRYQKALSICRRLYSKKSHPDGHPLFAMCLHNVAIPLEMLGETTQAKNYVDRAINMYEKLNLGSDATIPNNQFAFCLETRARLWRTLGDLDKSIEDARAALTRRRKVFGSDAFPSGHRDLARSLSRLAALKGCQGNEAEAIELQAESLEMTRRLFPKQSHPDGHPDIAERLNNLSIAHANIGLIESAVELAKESVEMNQRLFASDQIPHGHCDLFRSQSNYGNVLLQAGQLEPGLDQLVAAYRGFQRQSTRVNATVSEGEAMNFVRAIPRVVDSLLTWWPESRSADELYRILWTARSIKTAVLSDRFARFRHARDARTKALYQRYLLVRQDLASVLRFRKSIPGVMQRLAAEKESLEKELLQRLPGPNILPRSDESDFARLKKHLPANSAVVEFFLYKSSRTQESAYAAFVVRANRTTARIDLGNAATIDRLIKEWRRWIFETPLRHRGQVVADSGIEKDQLPEDLKKYLDLVYDTEANEELARLVWNPIASAIADAKPKCDRVYLVPDGTLCFLPFNALPARDENETAAREPPAEYLIQNIEIVQAPSVPWLAEQLAVGNAATDNGKDSLLAMGGVCYDQPADPAVPGFVETVFPWSADQADRENFRKDSKGFLAGSVVESNYAMHCFGSKLKLLASGQFAGVKSMTSLLPRARFALLATHGKYSSETSGSQSDPVMLDSSLILQGRELISPVDRNPFLRSGLDVSGSLAVDAGASRTRLPSGQLTAQQIATLPLGNLHWAFLTACQTSLGDVRPGEEVYSLPTAFHLAGARNVIATLWSVPDSQTSRISMACCYKVFKQDKSPATAIRESQLAYLASPQKMADWDGTEAPPAHKVDQQKPGELTDQQKRMREPYFWAAFQFSGAAP